MWSAFLHGKAFKKMERKDFTGAAKILERLCEGGKSDNIEYSYYSLGLCYYSLGNYNKALNWFSKSYKLYRQTVTSKLDAKYKNLKELVPLYCHSLKREGKGKLAEEIQADLDKIS